MKKKIISLLLAVIMIAGMLPLSAITAFADTVGETHTLTFTDALNKTVEVAHGECLPIGDFPNPDHTLKNYLSLGWQYEKDGKTYFFNETVPVTEDLTLTYCQMSVEEVSDYPDKTEITASDKTSLTSLSGIYTVSVGSDIVIDNRCAVHGFAVIILPDGCNITFSKGINVTEYRKLFIIAPDGAKGTGRLTATGEDNAAGIGGDKNATGGTVDIYGGTVKATGGFKAAGIGGGDEGNGGTVHIYGGTVTATGGVNGAGIGGGFFRNGGTVNISGGTVTATGGEFSAGIGGGNGGYGGTVYISGGAVNATGGYRATGIGGGDGGNGGTVYISGGVTRAEGTTASFKSDVTLRSNMTAYDITNGEENAPMTTAYTSLKKILVIPAPYDYLAVERNAYIDTGVKPTNNTRVVMDVDVKGGREYWFGVWDIDFDKSAFALGNDMTGIYTGYGDEGGTYGQAVSNGYHTVELDKNSVKVDGNLINTHKAAEFQLNNTLYLFAQNRAGEAMVYADQSTIHCYGCEIYEGNTLVRKFVPGKNSSDASGLWDLVNGVFYENKFQDKDNYAEMTAKYTGDVETVSEQSPTCLKNGRSAYYKKSGKYYTDAQCTVEITDLSVWLSTSSENGGGILPALGHDWDGSLEKHTCSRCKLEEPHIDTNNDKHCDTCDNELLTSRDVVYLNRTVNETTGAVTTEEVRFTGDAYTVLKSDKVWGESEKTTWYILDNDVTLNNRVEVRGDVRLILRDGKTLTANHGITVEEGNILSIYAQTDDENEIGVLSITTDGQTAIGGRNGGKGKDDEKISGGGGSGNPGFDGGTAGNIRFFGGKSILSSTGAVTVGGGNGGDGGNGANNGGNGGNGGDGGSVYFYGGRQTLNSANVSVIGGGNGGGGGHGDVGRDGKNGNGGGNATVTVCDTLLMKAGDDADSAVAVDGYNGQAYLQVSPPTEYYEFNASSKVFERKSTQTIPTPIESINDDLILDGGWYIVSGEVTVKSVTFKGDAHIIIANDAVFTATYGIATVSGADLTFYAQTEDFDHMGKVSVTKAYPGNAGIGSKNQGTCGNITINGGVFDVLSGVDGAGIGGGADSTCGIITINGGKIFTQACDFGAGIGSGSIMNNGHPACAGVVINGGAMIVIGGEGAQSIGAGYGSGEVSVNDDGVYKYSNDPRFTYVNIEPFPQTEPSCVAGHLTYFKNHANGRYYTTDRLDPDSLIKNIDEWLAGEGKVGEGNGKHADADNDGYCDTCGTLAQVEIKYYFYSNTDTPNFTVTCKAGEKLLEQIDGKAINTVESAFSGTVGISNHLYSNGNFVKEYDLVPFSTESMDIYALLVYDETKPTRTKNGHKEYYEDTRNGLFFTDSNCTNSIGDADNLAEWLSTPVEEGGGMIPAMGELPLATPTADDFTFIPPEDCVYDGQPKPASVTGKDGMGNITVKYAKWGGSDWDTPVTDVPTEIGKYKVYISVGEGTNFAASAEDITNDEWVFEITAHIPTLADIIDTVGGTYSGTAEWRNGYGTNEITVYVTLNEDEFIIETVRTDSEGKKATKSVLGKSDKKVWNTMQFNDFGAPIYANTYDETDTDTIVDFLNTQISLTPLDHQLKILPCGSVTIPVGSLSMDGYAFYDERNGKTQKLYMESMSMELTRKRESFTLRELIYEVGGTYGYTGMTPYENETADINATVTVNEDEYCLEYIMVHPDGTVDGRKLIYNANGGKEWVITGLDRYGKPICGANPTFETDETINNLLNYEVTVNRYPVNIEGQGMGITSVTVPAGSYYIEDLETYFYGILNGKTQKLRYGTIEYQRVTEPPHKHIYGSATYIWNDDLSQCTAFKICSCGNAVVETVDTVREGDTYTATFSDAFETQVKTAPASAHEHIFSTAWSKNAINHWHNATCGCDEDVVSDFGLHTFGEGVKDGNKTVYTCTECGYQKFVYNPAEDTEGEIVTGTTYTGISLTLGSDISINFYMELSEEARQNGTMTFDIGGRVVTGVKIKYNETEKKYYFQTPLTALEMNETVIATFNYNGVDYIQEYSVADYIEEIVGNPGKYGDYAAALAKKIANYGHYAQTYLASIHKNVVIGDDGYAEMYKCCDVDIKVADAKTALENYKVTVTGESTNLSLFGSTVYFDSATALNYYVTVANGVKPTATAINKVTGKTKQVEIKLYKDNIYIVSVKDITATELADDIEVTINNEITLTGSVFAYCNSVVKAHSFDGASEKDTFAVNAMAAFYEYYDAAMEYISFELHFDMPEHYKAFTADGEEITGDTTVKCYRTFSFRLVPDENYIISRVISGQDIEPDENGLYTVSYVGGKHNVAVYTKIDSYCLTVTVEGEDGGEMPDTNISFVCDGDETIYAQCFTPGIYQIEIPKGKSGTIVVEKSGYKEYSQKFTADGKVEEITVNLIPND